MFCRAPGWVGWEKCRIGGLLCLWCGVFSLCVIRHSCCFTGCGGCSHPVWARGGPMGRVGLESGAEGRSAACR